MKLRVLGEPMQSAAIYTTRCRTRSSLSFARDQLLLPAGLDLAKVRPNTDAARRSHDGSAALHLAQGRRSHAAAHEPSWALTVASNRVAAIRPRFGKDHLDWRHFDCNGRLPFGARPRSFVAYASGARQRPPCGRFNVGREGLLLADQRCEEGSAYRPSKTTCPQMARKSLLTDFTPPTPCATLTASLTASGELTIPLS